jgi:hypothetical protein
VSLYEKLRERAAGGEPAGLCPTMRVCVAGGDSQLHKVFQAYAVLRCAFPRLCTHGAIRFFLVPTGSRNSDRLAAFIAANDGWYRRHIYAPNALGSPTVPHLIVPQQTTHTHGGAGGGGGGGGGGGESESGEPPLLPTAPLRACLSDYLRAASATLDVQIREASCWLGSPQMPGPEVTGPAARKPTEPAFITIAFGQSLEVVGVPGGVPSLADGVCVNVTYTLSDPWGVPYPTYASVSARFSTLSLHNYAVAPFHSPAAKRMLMRCSLAGTKPVKQPDRYVQTMSVSAIGGGGAGQHDGAGFTPRGGSRSGEPPRFGLLVDGEYYGPFAHVTVGACVPPDGTEPISLPLATFFPVDEDGTSE